MSALSVTVCHLRVALIRFRAAAPSQIASLRKSRSPFRLRTASCRTAGSPFWTTAKNWQRPASCRLCSALGWRAASSARLRPRSSLKLCSSPGGRVGARCAWFAVPSFYSCEQTRARSAKLWTCTFGQNLLLGGALACTSVLSKRRPDNSCGASLTPFASSFLSSVICARSRSTS